MKKFLTIVALAAIILASCSTRVDLFCDNGDTTIVYSVLEVNADTNYFRITKSSLYNEIMYNYNDIDVKFVGLFKDEAQPDTIMLDTISKLVDGEMIMYYYTTKKLRIGQEYTLLIHRKADDVTVSSKTSTICNINFRKPTGKYIDFKSIFRSRIEWVGSGASIAPQINASFFDVTTFFHYKELMPGATDTVERYMEWPMVSEQAHNLYNTTNFNYVTYYKPATFFDRLERDNYLVNNSPIGVQRWLMPFEIRVTAYGEELYNYYIVNNSTSAIQDIPNYTNIDNGIGLMSSRTVVSTFHVIEQICRIRIANNYPYGFYYDPNL